MVRRRLQLGRSRSRPARTSGYRPSRRRTRRPARAIPEAHVAASKMTKAPTPNQSRPPQPNYWTTVILPCEERLACRLRYPCCAARCIYSFLANPNYSNASVIDDDRLTQMVGRRRTINMQWPLWARVSRTSPGSIPWRQTGGGAFILSRCRTVRSGRHSSWYWDADCRVSQTKSRSAAQVFVAHAATVRCLPARR